MYAKGVSTRDIENHMRDIYCIAVSPTMVSKITDKVMPMIAEWQSRPLERIYPIVFLDAIHFKIRQDSRIINKYPHAMRKMIYTTNMIEGCHRQLRKVTKTKTAYPSDETLIKIVYLATMDISRKWTMPV